MRAKISYIAWDGANQAAFEEQRSAATRNSPTRDIYLMTLGVTYATHGVTTVTSGLHQRRLYQVANKVDPQALRSG